MKRLINVPFVAFLMLTIVLASCGSSRTTTSKRYPYPGSPYPYPDNRYPYPDSRYPSGYPYPGNYPADRYPDYGRYPNHLPPGQAKKVYGNKSARVYAPGQRKKYKRDEHWDKKYNGKNEHAKKSQDDYRR